MIRRLVPFAAPLGIAFVVLLSLAGPVLAHARLVASTPGAGSRVTTTPKELRLVFSEPLDEGYSSADIVGANGTPLASGIGAPDPADERVLVAQMPALPDGVYTVVWRTLSAADGHGEEGAFSFGVGAGGAVTRPAGSGAAAGESHADSAETQATFLLDAGVLLAFGLVVIAWAVLDPLPGDLGRKAIVAAGAALLVAAAGATLVIVAAAAVVSADPIQYATRTRPGLLLLARAAIGLGGGLGVLGLARFGQRGTASDVAMFAGAAVLGLTAMSGHAAAFASPAPILADVVHLGAAATWLAGLAVLVALATFGRADASTLQTIVPRFSALALVAVALIVLTGTYAAWLETRDFTAFDDPYVRILAIKVAVAVIAFGVGAANYLSDPGGTRLGGLGRRVGVEAGLAVVVVVATAALTNGAPAAGGRPIPLAEASTSVSSNGGAALAIGPGRPGPNHFVVRLEGEAASNAATGEVALSLTRLDAPAAPLVQPLSPVAGTYVGDVAGLTADSRWSATVEVRRPDGTSVSRTRFDFGMGTDGVSSGRATPPIDPALLAALILAAAGLLATVFAVASSRPPRVEPRTGRLALLVGGPVSAALGIVLLVVRPAG